MNKISDHIKKIICKIMEINISEINNHTRLIKDLEIDSLDIIDIIMTIEEELNIEIPENIIEKFNTVDSIIKYVENIKK